MGLLERYRRYDDLSPEERRRRALERREEQRRGREEKGVVDLSDTSLPTLPNPEVVNAAIAVVRTRLHAYADPAGVAARAAIAERHGIDRSQVVIGNGAAELLRAGAQALLSARDELVTPWPSYPLYPELARRADARLVPVPASAGAADLDALHSTVSERTRVIVLCNPNDPTGGYVRSERVAELLDRLPERAFLFLDETLAHFQSAEPLDAGLALVERFPRLIVFRTLSKAYGFPGLRVGYAVGSKQAPYELLESFGPELGVNAVSQAAMAYAVTRVEYDVERRRQAVRIERERFQASLRALPIETAASEANFVWLRVPGMRSVELAARLERSGVLVARGERFGDRDHVRVGVRDGTATSRVVAALRAATERGSDPAGNEPPG